MEADLNFDQAHTHTNTQIPTHGLHQETPMNAILKELLFLSRKSKSGGSGTIPLSLACSLPNLWPWAMLFGDDGSWSSKPPLEHPPPSCCINKEEKQTTNTNTVRAFPIDV